MKKLVAFIICCGIMSACSPSVEQKFYPLPQELEHCKVHHINNGYYEMRVIHCPDKECVNTSYSSGKTPVNSAVCY